ncbi:YWFCY domain-containing protein [uncultured Fibrella sp.]|uniref:YWFCY domain-containing protein n=1 Tax=uncultured Fibrella sp. TaxID=1284596 RepID=UPI0035CAF185
MAELTNKEKEGYAVGVELFLLIGILFIILHFLWFNHELVAKLALIDNFIFPIFDKLNHQTDLFRSPWLTKSLAMLMILLHSLGSKGKLEPNLSIRQVGISAVIGLLLFFGSVGLLYVKASVGPMVINPIYICLTLIGCFKLVKAGQLLSRLLIGRPRNDIFNEENEEFPQNEQLLANEYSIHFRTLYHLKGKWREGIVNIVNPFRSTMVLGVPGSGKSYAVLIPALWQSIYKGYTAYVYDFKFPDLTEEAYNAYRKTIAENPYAWSTDEQRKARTPNIPKFYVINFDDIAYSHRCNPLLPELMTDIMDAYESAQTIMLNLNRSWAQKQGEFFPESAINYLTSVIWYLRTVSMEYKQLYQELGQTDRPEEASEALLHEKQLSDYYRLSQICTFPHTLEFLNRSYDEMFGLMELYPEVEIYVRPFIDAKAGGAMEQLEGQIASVRIPMARLSSPTLYWVMTGNDFSLDINNPAEPKILCTGNNPERVSIYGTAFSLYTSRMMKLVNKKGKLKSALFWDELPTMFIKGIDMLIATARSNKVATWLGIQDFEQLIRDYGEREAKVIMNIIGNVFSGTVVFETAEKLARRFGKTNQEKESVTYSKSDTTINVSTQQADMIPASKISTLKQGEFVGQFVDNFGEEFDLKAFKAFVVVEEAQLKKDHKLPVINDLSKIINRKYADQLKAAGHDLYDNLPDSEKMHWRNRLLQEHYYRVKQDISLLVEYESVRHGLSLHAA